MKARALIGLGRDEAGARRLLVHARELYDANKMIERVTQIDAYLGGAGTRRP